MAAWLAREGFTSPFVRWYVRYATLDDFGAELDDVSAWAGLHYFAARKLRTEQLEGSNYLVWPEGNGWLVRRLLDRLRLRRLHGTLVTQVRPRPRGGVDVEALRGSGGEILLQTPAERALGLAILQFGEALELAAADYRPNQLTNYLFELAGRYSTFFEQCPVLKAPTDELRHSRLLLCDLTARVIRQSLELLGIDVVEKM